MSTLDRVAMDAAEHLNDREKAAALEDLILAFREEYWDIEGHWLTIDGGADVSDETVRVLTLMRDAVITEYGKVGK